MESILLSTLAVAVMALIFGGFKVSWPGAEPAKASIYMPLSLEAELPTCLKHVLAWIAGDVVWHDDHGTFSSKKPLVCTQGYAGHNSRHGLGAEPGREILLKLAAILVTKGDTCSPDCILDLWCLCT